MTLISWSPDCSHEDVGLLERAFGGSTSTLVMQALAAKRTSPDELREIRRLLTAYQEKEHD